MSQWNRPLLDVVIPARNEEDNIHKVLNIIGFHRLIRKVFVMVDGDTIDQTANMASHINHKVEVIESDLKGKGQLVTAALKMVETERVIFFDADVTNITPIHIDILTEPNLADMIILVPQIPADLDTQLDEDEIRRLMYAWPYVSGERSVPTKEVRSLNLHGYLMESQINNLARECKWSTYYQSVRIESPMRFNAQRFIERDRDYIWGKEHGILQ